ncbi:MAG TPA: hypothetical protein VG674_04585, partial [Amycolatopsis sp.]|nr:hypothetical protein [Amycolatopsis sp.]
MSKRLFSTAAAVLAAGAALTLTAAPTGSAATATTQTRAANPISDDEVRAILARLDATGTLSPEDRAALATRP